MTKANNTRRGKCGIASTQPEPKATNKNTMRVDPLPGEDEERTLARVRLHPVANAAMTARQFNQPLADLGFPAVIGELSQHVTDAKAGNMSRPEAMLLTQAHTLDVIFHALAQRAGANVGTHRDTAETYLRMALKAQSQCRATLETLAEIKAPKSAMFIKQANIAGQQQVNNGDVNNGSSTHAHGKNINPNRSNELLESQHGKRLDTRAPSAASGVNSDMETVAAIDRPANKRRKGPQ